MRQIFRSFKPSQDRPRSLHACGNEAFPLYEEREQTLDGMRGSSVKLTTLSWEKPIHPLTAQYYQGRSAKPKHGPRREASLLEIER
ncbi:hypothetical protein thsrh120_46510 [Rhizobium sp. No.120]